ncbi:MAG: efflux RND transporter periplasmic adaptor subunit [Acidobacteriota bacterium]
MAELRIERSEPVEKPPRRWPLVVLGLLVLVVAAAWFLTKRSIPVVTTVRARQVSARSQGTVLNASGYVTARRQATVSSKVTGKVVEVLIEEGMAVAEGQILARLDTSNVEANLRLAEAQLASARTALRETEVRIAEAGLELGRVHKLVEQQISSQADLDVAQAEYDSLQARLDRQQVEARVAEQQVVVWRQEVEDRIIRAPFSGIVVSKNAQPGEMISPVSAGGGFTRTGIGTIVDMTSLEIEVDVNEAYINRVSANQPVVATLDAYPDGPIPGHVIAIIPTADRQKATVQVRVAFDELDSRILPDMGVKVAFQESTDGARAATAVAVASAAVRRDRGKDVVLVLNGELIERRAVEVGNDLGDEVLISAGLNAGEAVVLEGPTTLRDGDRVRESQP